MRACSPAATRPTRRAGRSPPIRPTATHAAPFLPSSRVRVTILAAAGKRKKKKKMDRRGSSPPPKRRSAPSPSLPYREDCWSEGETSVLIDAWGERFVDLSRGNLRQKHWQEVADAVNSRPAGARRLPRTDVQCKNRVDTLKKKYKLEKSRISGAGSPWAFYDRMDVLVGPVISNSGVKTSPPSPLPLALPLPSHWKGSALPIAAAAAAAAAAARPEKLHAPAPPLLDESFRRKNTKESSSYRSPPSESSSRSSGSSGGGGERSVKRRKASSGEEDYDDGIRGIARAITRFGEIYERMEGAKQRQVVEMERQKIEFAKEMEFQRMQAFVELQIKLEKIKRSMKPGAGDLESLVSIPFLLDPVALNL